MKFLVAVSLIVAVVSVLPFGAAALTVSPVKIEISGDPGQTLRDEITLFNEQDTAKTFFSSSENFEARGETGDPYFVASTTGLATWITTKESVTLKPGERKTIPFSILVPKNAEPGGHFAAIFWSTTPLQKQEGGQVAIGAKLGILVLLRVSGELKEGGGLLEFKAERGRVLTSLPITFIYRFSNDGNDRIKPEGEIKIKNILGFTSAVLDANKGEGNVLPTSIRKFNALWHSGGQRIADLTKKEELALLESVAEERKKEKGFFEAAGAQWSNFAFGVYNAQLALTFGQDNKTTKASFRFLVIPWQLLSIVIIILAVAGFFGRIGLKRYNRWVIKKARL